LVVNVYSFVVELLLVMEANWCTKCSMPGTDEQVPDYQGMSSFQVITFLSLDNTSFNIISLVKTFQTGCSYFFSLSHTVIYSNQVIVRVFHSHLLLVLAPTVLPSSILPLFSSSHLVYKAPPFQRGFELQNSDILEKPLLLGQNPLEINQSLLFQMVIQN